MSICDIESFTPHLILYTLLMYCDVVYVCLTMCNNNHLHLRLTSDYPHSPGSDTSCLLAAEYVFSQCIASVLLASYKQRQSLDKRKIDGQKQQLVRIQQQNSKYLDLIETRNQENQQEQQAHQAAIKD